MARLFKMEIVFHGEVEALKQRMETHPGYSHRVAFKTIDPTNIGFIEVKTMDNFFKQNKIKGITLEDNAAVIRRFDLDNDGKLRFEEFEKGIGAEQPFSKMLIRNGMKKEKDYAKQIELVER
jgi:Ca2+-binding EF-hand superfamily protein